jgi:hypothetical protein
MAAGATDNGKPGVRLYYDPRYYAGNVFDPDGYSLEFVFNSWQHSKPKPRPPQSKLRHNPRPLGRLRCATRTKEKSRVYSASHPY